MRSPGSFGLPDHPGRLSRTGGPPGAPGRHVGPGVFRPVLTEASGHGDRPEGGRPPRDRGHGPAGGRTVDAASVPAPRRRMTGKGRERAGAGGSAADVRPDGPAGVARKDIGARRTAGHSGARKTGGGEPDPANGTGSVRADTGHRPAGNGPRPKARGHRSRIHRGKPRGGPMPGHVRRGDATRPSIRAGVGHVSGYGKGPMAVTFRRVGRFRAAARMTMANPGHGFRHPVLHERRQARAWLRPESGNHPPDIRAGIWVYRGFQLAR